MNSEDQERTAMRRRTVLAALGATLMGGCVRRVESVMSRDAPKQVSLDIKTVPADADPIATQIARYLSTRLTSVGIDARVVPMSREERARDVLINQDFDMYVGQFPEQHDPDFLRPLLHSRYNAALGWQNPFGYGNLELDSALEAQAKQPPGARQTTLDTIQRTIARDQPFSVVAFPDVIQAVRHEETTGWEEAPLNSLESYLALERRSEAPVDDELGGEWNGSDETEWNETETTAAESTSEQSLLRMTLTDTRPTENLNPLSAEFRDQDPVTDLLYDSLGRWSGAEVDPWLAESWTWEQQGDTPVVDVTLRDDLSWHDGERLTTSDVAFTYEFLADTSLGEQDSPVPAPRHQGAISLVDDVEVLDADRVAITFQGSSPEVARQALTVPILPSHVWDQFNGQAGVAGLNADGSVTEALVRNNLPPVGSGPFRVTDVSIQESVRMVPFEDHFLQRDDASTLGDAYQGGFDFDMLEFVVVPSSAAAVGHLIDRRADATASPLHPSAVRRVATSNELDLQVRPSRAFYHIGYNLRRSPLTNPRFRRAVASLLDKSFIVEQFFGGYATPAASPLAGTSAIAPSLEWEGSDPELPFLGSNGTVDVERAKEMFRNAGYRYTNDGRLVSK